MKKIIFTTILILSCIISNAQDRPHERTRLSGFNAGIGIPVEWLDLEAVGLKCQLGYDFAHPVKDNLAIGFYLGADYGFLEAIHPYSKYDKRYSNFHLSAGLLMEIGDLTKRPFLLGISPCLGLGFVDMDLILPIELRFGRFVSKNWYVMGEVSYGLSLAKETVSLQPAIRVGYNIPHKTRKKK